MLQHDYIHGLIQEFGRAVSEALRRVFFAGSRETAEEAGADVEVAVGQLIDLDADTAMALSPESLVTMIQLSGVGESVAGYAAWALDRLADAYELQGDVRSSTRRDQARAIATAFNCDLSQCPEEFTELEAELEDKGLI